MSVTEAMRPKAESASPETHAREVARPRRGDDIGAVPIAPGGRPAGGPGPGDIADAAPPPPSGDLPRAVAGNRA